MRLRSDPHHSCTLPSATQKRRSNCPTKLLAMQTTVACSMRKRPRPHPPRILVKQTSSWCAGTPVKARARTRALQVQALFALGTHHSGLAHLAQQPAQPRPQEPT